MRWLHAVVAEVARCFDKADAKVALPNAIYHDACRERVLGAGDPVGKRGPPLLLGRLLVQLHVAERAEHGGDKFLLRLLRISAIEQMDFVWFAEDAGEDFL
jgi:hypothetical protein